MGLCHYCKTKAGLLKDEHATCAKDAEVALANIEVIARAATAKGTAAEIAPRIAEEIQRGRLTSAVANAVGLAGLNHDCLMMAPQQPTSTEEYSRLGELFTVFDPEFFQADGRRLLRSPGYMAVVLSHTLYQVMQGTIPYWGDAPVNFMLGRNEHPIVRRRCSLAEYRNVSAGRSYHSVGIPIGGGMYYRIGASTPKTTHLNLVVVDEGELLITDRAIYFGGQQSTFKVPYTSILRLDSYTDGFGVHENFGSGKVFIPGNPGFEDGWFFHNLVSTLTARVAHLAT